MAKVSARKLKKASGVTYGCGLRPGDRVRLRKDLVIRDHLNRPTGEVHVKGEVWTVLPDCCGLHHDLWLEQPDGSPHTWDDSKDTVREWFDLVKPRRKARKPGTKSAG